MIKRYHKNVFFPGDSREKIRDFIISLMHKKITFKHHALKRYRKFNRRTKTSIKSILHNSIPLGNINEENVFEIYLNRRGEITKAGIRFPIINNDIAIILILTSTGHIVTIYVNKIDDHHASLDDSVYEKE